MYLITASILRQYDITVIVSTGFHSMLVKEWLPLLTCQVADWNLDRFHKCWFCPWYRSLNALFHFLIILILFGACNQLFYVCTLVWMWPGDISMCSACFLVKQYTVFNWKDAFSVIYVSPGSVKTLFRWSKKVNQFLIYQTLSNAFAKKNYENQIMLARVTAKNVGEIVYMESTCLCQSLSTL